MTHPLALLVHAAPQVVPAYETALNLPVHRVQSRRSQLSAGYDERTGIARDYPTLDAAVKRYAPDADPDSPVVLVAWSAGCWAARAWLRDPEARLRTVAAVFLDGLHSRNPTAMAGVEDYARMAMSQKGRACVVTHTQIVPPYTSTTQSATWLSQRLGLPRLEDGDSVNVGGLHILPHAGADKAAHCRQLTEVGLEVCRRYVVPLLEPDPLDWEDIRPLLIPLEVDWEEVERLRAAELEEM